MTPEARYAANLALIAVKNPALADQLRQFPLVGVDLLPAQDGSLFGRLWSPEHQGWVPLCSPEGPLAEAQHDVDQLYNAQSKVFVLLGMGLGYFAVEFAKRLKPWQRLAIFEQSPHCYKAAMYAVDMAPLLGERRVDTSLGDNLADALQHFWLSLDSHEKFHLAMPMRSAHTQAVQVPLYEGLLMQSLDMLRYHAVGLATWKQFGGHIGDNDLDNLPEYYLTPGLNVLADAWQGKPAVCIAAGPSLAKNVRFLLDPAVRRKVAVLTVGTMYAPLRALGIQPDLVTTIDFQRLNWTDQFRGLPLERDLPLVYLHSTYPQTVRRWPGPRFVGLNGSDTTAWMQTFAEPKDAAAQVQTVAHLNLVVALRLGANPIILLGQDLAMPKDAHHAPGARAQDQLVDEAPDSHVNADDIYGQPTWTRHSLLSMRTVFQHYAAAHPDRQMVNCTEGGIAIQGIPNVPFQAALAALPEGASGPSARALAGERFRAYTPQVQWEAVHTQLATLTAQAAALGEWAETVLAQDARRATLAEGLAERDVLRDAVIGSEAVITSLGAAFALYAVRCFDVIELMAAIPLDPGTQEPDAFAAYQYGRIVQVAQSLQQATPVIRRLLRRTQRRLADVAPRTTPPSMTELQRMLARQSYRSAQRWLTEASLTWHGNGAAPGVAMRTGARMTAQGLFAQQQYQAAVAVCEAWALAPGLRAKCLAALSSAATSTQGAFPAYLPLWPTPAAAPPLAVVAADGPPEASEPPSAAVA